MSRKAPRFFCDNCGAEVPLKAKSCPGCGRFFDSVRCPACGFSAEEERFKNGCPVCGYSAPPGSSSAWFTKDNPESVRFPVKAAGPLPIWVYVIAISGLVLILAALFFLIK